MEIAIFIGILSALALGIIIYMLWINEKDARQREREDALLHSWNEENQAHESGFIDIPMQNLMSKRDIENESGRSAFKRRMYKFKLRNRFYR